jgi:surface polysaccharide O-acyltransferase-like enzyme
MSLTMMEVPIARSGVRAERLVFIDNLRWSAISMVVVIHAAVTYSAVGSWYYYDHAATGRTATIWFGTYQSFQHAVAMGLLFGIAGFFARAAVERKGTAAFLRERAFRLGLPLLLYTLVIDPVTEYFIAGSWRSRVPVSFPQAWLDHITDGEVFSNSGPLWFCLVLMLFSLCYAAAYRLLPVVRAGGPLRVPGAAAVLLYAVAMAAVTFAAGLLAPHGGMVLNVPVLDFPQYPLMFAAGVMAQRGNWPLRFSTRAGRAWLFGGLAASALIWAVIITQGGALHGHLREYFGGWHWQAAAMDVWRSVTCLSLSIGLVVLYRDRCNSHGPVSRFLTRNAFGVYVFHPPILIAATVILHDWPAAVAIKFAIASVAAIVLTFLFVGTIARRTPWLRAIV